jgi:hypothetical protein
MPYEMSCLLTPSQPRQKIKVWVVVADTTVTPETITTPPPTSVLFNLAALPDIAEIAVSQNEVTVALKPTAQLHDEQEIAVNVSHTIGAQTATFTGKITVRVVANDPPPPDPAAVIRGITMTNEPRY